MRDPTERLRGILEAIAVIERYALATRPVSSRTKCGATPKPNAGVAPATLTLRSAPVALHPVAVLPMRLDPDPLRRRGVTRIWRVIGRGRRVDWRRGVDRRSDDHRR